MSIYSSVTRIKQLGKRRGGYFYLMLPSEVVNGWRDKRATRLICVLDKHLEFRCGLNHLGDGNFFVILSAANLKKAGKVLGDEIHLDVLEDPNPLGVDVPEVLQVLLDQDAVLNRKYDQLTMGKKRNVIHTINRIKDIDKQVQQAISLIGGSQ